LFTFIPFANSIAPFTPISLSSMMSKIFTQIQDVERGTGSE